MVRTTTILFPPLSRLLAGAIKPRATAVRPATLVKAPRRALHHLPHRPSILRGLAVLVSKARNAISHFSGEPPAVHRRSRAPPIASAAAGFPPSPLSPRI
jgi:hypothetical protein